MSDVRSVRMADMDSIKRRHTQYDWGERHRRVRYLSLWLLVFGALLIVTGIAISVLMITGRIPLPYASSTKILVSAGILILGLLLGSGLLAVSRTLAMVKDIETSTRFAMNIWFILEERDLSEENVPAESLPEEEES